MNATDNIATDLFYKIRSRFSGLKLGDEIGQITINPEDARFFDFDYVEESGNALGHISISLAEPNSMKVYFSTGITEGMDDGQKDSWYGFLKELRGFAKRRLIAFDTRDITKDNLDKRDYAFLSQYATPKSNGKNVITKPVGEGLMNESNLYGTRTQSFQKLMDTRLIIKHSKAVMDDQTPGARARNISALFVENQEGERFKYPFIHLAGARAMQRHVANGGLPYDAIGESIIKMSEEIAQLKSFKNYVVRNDLMNSDTNTVVDRATGTLDAMKEQIAKLGKQSHYEAYVENFQAVNQPEISDEMMEEFKEKFTVKKFNEEMTDVFPVLARLMAEENAVGYDDIVEMTKAEASKYHCKDCGDTMHNPTTDCPHDSHDENGKHWVDENGNGIHDMDESADPLKEFESWVMSLGEDSPIQSSDDSERETAIKELQELVGQDFPAGVDGTNAIQSMEGIIDDPRLEQDIKKKAMEDSNIDIRPLVKAWIEENAPEALDKLDFGDMSDGPAVGADEVEPQQEGFDPESFEGEFEMEVAGDDGEEDMIYVSYMANIEDGRPVVDPKSLKAASAMKNPNAKMTDEYAQDIVDKYEHDEAMEYAQEDADEQWAERDNKYAHGESADESEGMNTSKLAEFIFSFYDKDSGTFPKGPEGVCTMVGKKFGEQAEAMARKLVERMAPQQEQGAEYIETEATENNELEDIKRLSGF